MLTVAVIVVGSSGFNTRRGMGVSRRGRLVIIAKRHRNRMQVLQRQAGDQHQQRKFLQETFHAAILTVGSRKLQAHVMTAVNGESSIDCVRRTIQTRSPRRANPGNGNLEFRLPHAENAAAYLP